MPQSNDGRKAFLAVTALARGIRVKLSGGGVIACGAGEKGIGYTTEATLINTFVNIRMDHHSVEATASGAIAVNDDCYPAAAGDVSATIAGARCGIALEVSADTERFELLVACVSS